MTLDRENRPVDSDGEVFIHRETVEGIFDRLGKPHMFCDLPPSELMPLRGKA